MKTESKEDCVLQAQIEISSAKLVVRHACSLYTYTRIFFSCEQECMQRLRLILDARQVLHSLLFPLLVLLQERFGAFTDRKAFGRPKVLRVHTASLGG